MFLAQRNFLAGPSSFMEYLQRFILCVDEWDALEIDRHNSAARPPRVSAIRRVDYHSFL